MNPVVVVHGGGASNISKDRKERVRQGIIRAATVGYNILQEGGSAVDAVEGAVTVLEDDPEFNAGCGSVLNVNGKVEMDASIMNGKDLSSGAVSAVRCIANPIKLARLVMEKTPHCFLTDQGAAKFAADMGVPEVPEKQLITERNIKHLEKEKNEKSAQKTDQQKDLGTVGAVALDSEGNVAYATSTGGIVNKMAGRVGDTPCIGSGGYADNRIGAISTTGHGESILKVNLARLTLFHIEQGRRDEFLRPGDERAGAVGKQAEKRLKPVLVCQRCRRQHLDSSPPSVRIKNLCCLALVFRSANDFPIDSSLVSCFQERQ